MVPLVVTLEDSSVDLVIIDVTISDVVIVGGAMVGGAMVGEVIVDGVIVVNCSFSAVALILVWGVVEGIGGLLHLFDSLKYSTIVSLDSCELIAQSEKCPVWFIREAIALSIIL